ncbi:hypothetical protein PENSPDRAFT_659803 [Peniophora sp. CONT]|nr:hypothetical protein PENSPDRAFT_659803 [Peniophora sp. CONT]
MSGLSESQLLEQEPLIRPEDVENTPVYPTIHAIKTDVMHFIDTPLSYEALAAPDLTYTLVRPLAEKYIHLQRSGNMSIVFCLLLNRVHFLRDETMLTQSLSRTRAELCEILAIRCLREYADNLLDLVTVSTTTWNVYSGAEPAIVERARQEYDGDLEDRVGNAIELAIISKARRMIKSNPGQKVIDAIWSGKCVYTAASSHAFLSDTYKRNPVHFYNPRTAPVLDHYRLKVPAIRSVLEYMNFSILFILFVICIELNEPTRLNAWEVLFMIYSLGFSLEKVAAMQEHGVKVYFTGIWNGFDVAFVSLYAAYATLSLYGIYGHHYRFRELGIDFLALIAILLFPRLVFVTLKDNLMILSLRAMLAQFAALMLIAMFCFGGFLYALWTFSRNGADYSASQIAWWMADLWFGLDAAGFEKASQFSVVFGPLVMVTYACLSNTLLLTVLVSILSNTFSTVSEDAEAEALFRRAASTIEGVKADSLFSYLPPVNIFALGFLYPMSYILTPRWFHKVNVFLIRLTNLPILAGISVYERQALKVGAAGLSETLSITLERFIDSLPRHLKRLVPSVFEGMVGSGSDIDVIFEVEEEYNSALDTSDGPPLNSRPRAVSFNTGSHPSSRRPSHSGAHPPAPTPTQGKTSALPALAMPRHRLTSILHEGADAARSAISPLAQIFQPIVIPEGSPDDTGNGSSPAGNSAGNGAAPVSYGPASRRRRISTVGGGLRPSDSHGPFTGGMRFPSSVSHGGSSLGGAVSESPEPHQEDPEVETAETTMGEDAEIGPIDLARRLSEIEKRQQRIEDLLGQIAGAMRK